MKRLAMASSALIFMAATALAQGVDTLPWSIDDFFTLYPDATSETFGMIDTDGDGTISPEEYEAAVDAGLIDPVEG